MSVSIKKCSRVLVSGYTRTNLWIKRGYAAQIYYLRGFIISGNLIETMPAAVWAICSRIFHCTDRNDGINDTSSDV